MWNLRPGRLRRVSEPSVVHPSQEPPTHPHSTAKRRTRGHPICQEAPEDRGVYLHLLPEGRHRRNDLTRSKGLRVTPSSLPGLGEDPLAGTCHCCFNQRRSNNQLAKRRPYRCYSALSIGGIGFRVIPTISPRFISSGSNSLKSRSGIVAPCQDAGWQDELSAGSLSRTTRHERPGLPPGRSLGSSYARMPCTGGRPEGRLAGRGRCARPPRL